MTSKIIANCCKCGYKAEVEINGSINIGECPEMKSRILDGSAFIWECPQCGVKSLLKYQTLYHDPESKLMIWLTCGDEGLEEKVRESYNSIEEMKQYTSRFVDDAGSLIEKIKIFDAGLDDLTIEMCKHVTKMELEKDIPLKFLKLDGADNDLLLTYPADGQMQVLTVGFNVYEDCRGIIQRNPDVEKMAEGFVKVDSGWIAQFFG